MDPATDPRPLISIHYYGLVMETLLYGVYLVLASITFWILNQRRKEGHPVSKIISVCCVVIFICTAIHWGGTVAQVYEGVVTYASRPDIGIALLYGNTTKVAIMRLAIYGVGGLTIDTMLIYRLWVVWGRSWAVIVVPVINTTVGLVPSIMIVVFAATTPVGIITSQLRISITISFCLHATTNILCTGLIVAKIFRNSMSVSTSKRQLMPLVWVIVESAAIYTALSLCLMGLLISAQPAALLFADIQPPMIGISSSLLIVRVAAGSATSSGPTNPSSRSRPFANARNGAVDSQYGDLPMKVSVTRHAHVTRDDDMERKMELGLDGSNPVTSSASSANGAV